MVSPLTLSPGQSSFLYVVTLVALAEVEQNEHVQHHPDQRGGQDHFTVGKPPHPERQRKEARTGEVEFSFTYSFKVVQEIAPSLASSTSVPTAVKFGLSISHHTCLMVYFRQIFGTIHLSE